jgi:alanine dehydrogenase
MLVLTAERIRALTSMPALVECLRAAFRGECSAPSRQVLPLPGGAAGRLLLSMPAFDSDGAAVVKLSTVFPDNEASELPTIQGAIVVFSDTGTPTALLDGAMVTKLRTGAASALASTYLSRSNSAHLMLIGTGALAPYMALAHCAVRPVTHISVYGRQPDRSGATAAAVRALVGSRIQVRVAEAIEHAVATADIVTCATSSAMPVLAGKWLAPGTFVDLVGSFSPSKRESDDDVVKRSRIFVDLHEAAFSEAGDILDPLGRGVIDRSRIEGDLADLTRGRVVGRRSDDEIIVFKSVGTAIEDLAAARLIVTTATAHSPG